MKRILAVCILLSVVAACPAADWPQWRGPNRDGKSTETGLLQSWPKSGPRLLWTFEGAGMGYSGPAIVGNVLYSMGGDDGKEEYIFAVDTTSGKQLWKTPIGKWFKNGWGGGPRGTPAVDGDHVFGLSAGGDVACVNKDTGKLIWKKNYKSDLKGKLMSMWGYSESVLVDRDRVICTPGGEDGTLAALNRLTGEVIWRSEGVTDDAAYSSPVMSEACGTRQYIQLTSKGLVGVDGTTGKMLWYVAGEGYKVAVIPTPCVQGDMVYATTDYGAKGMLVKLSKSGNTIKAEKVYSNKLLENHHGGVILHEGHVYGSHGNANNRKSLPFVCMNVESGKVAWTEEKKVEPSGITFADGHFYCYGQETGVLVKIAAKSDGFHEVARFTIPRETKNRNPQGAIWTHPVIANGKLYLRDQELLFCFDLSGARAAK